MAKNMKFYSPRKNSKRNRAFPSHRAPETRKKRHKTFQSGHKQRRQRDVSVYPYGQGSSKATAKVAKERKQKEKPIVFSICEWGWGKPYNWGAKAGNLWRTTPDIRPWWWWIKLIYEHTVKLYKYASKGHYNDPDMLEVGNGKLSYNQNVSHFSLWCMMNAPLILGNDLRNMSDQVKSIVTNRNMIAINQDSLAKQAKRVKKAQWTCLQNRLRTARSPCVSSTKPRMQNLASSI